MAQRYMYKNWSDFKAVPAEPNFLLTASFSTCFDAIPKVHSLVQMILLCQTAVLGTPGLPLSSGSVRDGHYIGRLNLENI